jgi:hypothetical protein
MDHAAHSLIHRVDRLNQPDDPIVYRLDQSSRRVDARIRRLESRNRGLDRRYRHSEPSSEGTDTACQDDGSEHRGHRRLCEGACSSYEGAASANLCLRSTRWGLDSRRHGDDCDRRRQSTPIPKEGGIRRPINSREDRSARVIRDGDCDRTGRWGERDCRRWPRDRTRSSPEQGRRGSCPRG